MKQGGPQNSLTKEKGAEFSPCEHAGTQSYEAMWNMTLPTQAELHKPMGNTSSGGGTLFILLFLGAGSGARRNKLPGMNLRHMGRAIPEYVPGSAFRVGSMRFGIACDCPNLSPLRVEGRLEKGPQTSPLLPSPGAVLTYPRLPRYPSAHS